MEADKLPIKTEYARPGDKNIKDAKIALINPKNSIPGSVSSGLPSWRVMLAAITIPKMKPPKNVGIIKFPRNVKKIRMIMMTYFLPNVIGMARR
ncbi:hypothetical protein [Luteolibacter sp. AS25]|uniref:hypothetical protein n=1 Tax=Luteolibacter sp. AS25 TaxID=3135776 RepID=UPI00398B1011